MSVGDDLPVVAFASVREWESWLDRQHETSRGLWIQVAKKGSGVASVTYEQALDSALCYGWIDGQKDRLDERFWLQRFTPRGPKSKWSAANRERATALVQQGRMLPAGLKEIESAKNDGRWEAAYEGQRTSSVPEDLRIALEQNPEAASFFSTLDRGNRYAILYRIADAKKPETRTRRIETFIDMLARHEAVRPTRASPGAT